MQAPRKTLFLPKSAISRMTGMTKVAVPTPLRAIGSVDKLLTDVRVSPIMPLINTIKTLGDINSAKLIVKIQTFLGSWSIARENIVSGDYNPIWTYIFKVASEYAMNLSKNN